MKMKYDLEMEKALSQIIETKSKKVLIQLPEGLKPNGKKIVDFLESKSNAKIHLWGGSCFGACDIPNVKGYDLLIQWGHNEFK